MICSLNESKVAVLYCYSVSGFTDYTTRRASVIRVGLQETEVVIGVNFSDILIKEKDLVRVCEEFV